MIGSAPPGFGGSVATEARVARHRRMHPSQRTVLAASWYDTRGRRMLGNFPQALTHMALIHTARLLSIPEHQVRRASARGERPATAAQT